MDPVKDPKALLRIDSHCGAASVVESTQRHSVGAVFGIAERGDNGASHITQIYASQGRLIGVVPQAPARRGRGGVHAWDREASLRYGRAELRDRNLRGRQASTTRSTSPVAAGAEIVFFCAAPGLHGRRTDEAAGARATRGGSPTGWQMRAATRRAPEPGSHSSPRRDPRSTRTSPGWPPSSRRKARSWRGFRTGRRALLTVDVPVGFEVDPVREAARVLVIDEAGRALLVQFSDDFGYSWWAAPGGGLATRRGPRSMRRCASSTKSSAATTSRSGPRSAGVATPFRSMAAPWITQHERWFMATHASVRRRGRAGRVVGSRGSDRGQVVVRRRPGRLRSRHLAAWARRSAGSARVGPTFRRPTPTSACESGSRYPLGMSWKDVVSVRSPPAFSEHRPVQVPAQPGPRRSGVGALRSGVVAIRASPQTAHGARAPARRTASRRAADTVAPRRPRS